MKYKKLTTGMVVVFFVAGIFFWGFLSGSHAQDPTSETTTQANLSNTVVASGDVEAENQANLAFINPGRVDTVNYKKGDHVKKGQVIASLDTTVAQHNVTAAQAQYQSAQAALDKVLDDIHLYQYGNGGLGNVGSANETQTQKSTREEAQAAVNAAYDNLQSAKKQLDFSTIVAPFDGTIFAMQNISEGANITPTSGAFVTLVGGGDLKFVANVLVQDSDKVQVGQNVTIKLDPDKDLALTGTVSQISSNKTTLPDGKNVFLVDVQSVDLQSLGKVGETGSIEIKVSATGVTTVPSWVVLGGKYVWVMENGQTVLKEVKVGQTQDGKTAILSGLNQFDQIITDPALIIKNKYPLL